MTRQLEIPGGERVDLVLIPAGAFTMGTPETEPTRGRSEKQDQVRITTPFYLASCVVTQAQWQAAMSGNPSLFKGKPDSPRRPVKHVSYIQISNELLPNLHAKAPSGWVVRLPTEAEWEWACRAGAGTSFWFGSITTEQGNDDASLVNGNRTPGGAWERNEVGAFPADPWGLHEMHGKVFQ